MDLLADEEVGSRGPRKQAASAVGGRPQRMRRLTNALLTPKTPFARVAPNKLTAECVAGGHHALDHACVRAALCMHDLPVVHHTGQATRLRYFEVSILALGRVGTAARICIGLAPGSWGAAAALGSEEGCIGYRCDSGHAHVGRATGEDYGPPCTAGDVIGVAYDATAKELWFSRNGVKLASRRAPSGKDYGALFPAASMHVCGERMKFNFDGPFVLDLAPFVEAQPAHVEAGASVQPLLSLPSDTRIMDGVVADFLLHYGYLGTYDALRESVHRRQLPAATCSHASDTWDAASYDQIVHNLCSSTVPAASRTTPSRVAGPVNTRGKLSASSSSSSSTPQLPIKNASSTPTQPGVRTPGVNFITSPLTPSLAALSASAAGMTPGLVSTPYFRARSGSGIPGSAYMTRARSDSAMSDDDFSASGSPGLLGAPGLSLTMPAYSLSSVTAGRDALQPLFEGAADGEDACMSPVAHPPSTLLGVLHTINHAPIPAGRVDASASGPPSQPSARAVVRSTLAAAVRAAASVGTISPSLFGSAAHGVANMADDAILAQLQSVATRAALPRPGHAIVSGAQASRDAIAATTSASTSMSDVYMNEQHRTTIRVGPGGASSRSLMNASAARLLSSITSSGSGSDDGVPVGAPGPQFHTTRLVDDSDDDAEAAGEHVYSIRGEGDEDDESSEGNDDNAQQLQGRLGSSSLPALRQQQDDAMSDFDDDIAAAAVSTQTRELWSAVAPLMTGPAAALLNEAGIMVGEDEGEQGITEYAALHSTRSDSLSGSDAAPTAELTSTGPTRRSRAATGSSSNEPAAAFPTTRAAVRPVTGAGPSVPTGNAAVARALVQILGPSLGGLAGQHTLDAATWYPSPGPNAVGRRARQDSGASAMSLIAETLHDTDTFSAPPSPSLPAHARMMSLSPILGPNASRSDRVFSDGTETSVPQRACVDSLLTSYGYGYAATSTAASVPARVGVSTSTTRLRATISSVREHSIPRLLSLQHLLMAKRRSAMLRHDVRVIVRAGDYANLVALLQHRAPFVLAYPPHAAMISVMLCCQRVLDALARGDVLTALHIARDEISPYMELHRDFTSDARSNSAMASSHIDAAVLSGRVPLSTALAEARSMHHAYVAAADAGVLSRARGWIRSVLSLLAYGNAASAPQAALMRPASRDVAADIINAAILEHDLAAAASNVYVSRYRALKDLHRSRVSAAVPRSSTVHGQARRIIDGVRSPTLTARADVSDDEDDDADGAGLYAAMRIGSASSAAVSLALEMAFEDDTAALRTMDAFDHRAHELLMAYERDVGRAATAASGAATAAASPRSSTARRTTLPVQASASTTTTARVTAAPADAGSLSSIMSWLGVNLSPRSLLSRARYAAEADSATRQAAGQGAAGASRLRPSAESDALRSRLLQDADALLLESLRTVMLGGTASRGAARSEAADSPAVVRRRAAVARALVAVASSEQLHEATALRDAAAAARASQQQRAPATAVTRSTATSARDVDLILWDAAVGYGDAAHATREDNGVAMDEDGTTTCEAASSSFLFPPSFFYDAAGIMPPCLLEQLLRARVQR